MPFDESLLRDEPSGFDESLLRDEEEQPVSVGELLKPTFQRTSFPIPLPPESEMPGIRSWAQAFSPDQPPSISAPPSLSLGERLAQRAERAVRSPEELAIAERAALGMGDMSEKAIAQSVPKETARRLGVTPFGEVQAPRVTSEQIESLGVPGIVAKPAAAIENVAAGLADFLTSAEGVMTLMGGAVSKAGTIAPRIIAGVISGPPEVRAAFEAARAGKGLDRGIATAFAADMARHTPDQLIRLTESLASGDVQGATEGFLNAAMQTAVTKHALTKGKPSTAMQFEVLPPEAKGGEIDASRIREATEVYGDVRPQPVQGQGQVPAEVRGEGVQSQARPLQEAAPGRTVDDLTKGPNETQRQKEVQEQGPVPVAQEPGAAPVAPEFTLTPAVEAEGRIFTGKNHSDAILHAIRKEGVDALDAPHNFLGSDGKMYNRKEAAKIYEEKTGKKPFAEEGLHSHELEEAGMLQHVTEPREVKPAAAKPEAIAPAIAEGKATKPVQGVSAGETAVGIAPPGTGLAQKIIEKFTSKEKGTAPPIKTDVTTPLPDFQEHNVSKGIFAQPFGWERIPILGAPLGGLRRAAGHINEAITTYWNEREIGKNITSSLANEYSWLDKPFQIVDGQIANIGAKPGQSRYISDVFEALQRDPTAYDLSPDQRKAFDAVQALEKDFNKLEKKYKLGKSADQELEGGEGVSTFLETGGPTGEVGKVTQASSYFPRIVTSRPEGSTSGLGRGKSVGAKAFFEKQRMFDTEAEGWAKGYKYEPSIVNRVATRAERLYKRIADKRLAEDKSLGGLSRKEQEAQLKATYAEELTSGEMTEATIGRMVDSLEQRGRVMQPAFYGKIFPEETAKALDKAFPRDSDAFLRGAVSVNDAIRTMKTGYDWGGPLIQGLPTLIRFPHRWGKAVFNSVKAFGSKEFLPKYVRSNLESIREATQSGISIGRLQDYMAGFGKGGILPRLGEALAPVPIIGKVAKGASEVTQAFGRSYSTFIDVAKIELWKAYSKRTPKEEWGDLARSIDSILLTSNLEASGVGPKRALAERALLFASSYYRGGLNLVGGAIMEKGISGSLMRQTIGALTLGGAAAFYGIGKALGMSDDDILRRFNPARSDFLSWRITMGDKTYEVGIGGFYRSMLRLVGDSVKTSVENPGNWLSLDPKKNPFVKWYRGHGGPSITTPWDQFTGKDYLGRETDLRSLGKSVVPLTLEKVTGGEGAPTPSIGELGASFVGLNVFPSQQPNTKETFVNIYNWMAKSEDPKVVKEFEDRQKADYPKPYAPLRQALAQNDTKAADKAYTELLKTREPGTIIKAIRPFSMTADYERHDKPLTGSKELERKFLESLSDEDRKLYDAAKKERMELWTRFQKVLEARSE